MVAAPPRLRAAGLAVPAAGLPVPATGVGLCPPLGCPYPPLGCSYVPPGCPCAPAGGGPQPPWPPPGGGSQVPWPPADIVHVPSSVVGGPAGASCSSGWAGGPDDAGVGPAQGTQESPGGVPPSSSGSGLSVGP